MGDITITNGSNLKIINTDQAENDVAAEVNDDDDMPDYCVNASFSLSYIIESNNLPLDSYELLTPIFFRAISHLHQCAYTHGIAFIPTIDDVTQLAFREAKELYPHIFPSPNQITTH